MQWRNYKPLTLKRFPFSSHWTCPPHLTLSIVCYSTGYCMQTRAQESLPLPRAGSNVQSVSPDLFLNSISDRSSFVKIGTHNLLNHFTQKGKYPHGSVFFICVVQCSYIPISKCHSTKLGHLEKAQPFLVITVCIMLDTQLHIGAFIRTCHHSPGLDVVKPWEVKGVSTIFLTKPEGVN